MKLNTVFLFCTCLSFGLKKLIISSTMTGRWSSKLVSVLSMLWSVTGTRVWGPSSVTKGLTIPVRLDLLTLGLIPLGWRTTQLVESWGEHFKHLIERRCVRKRGRTCFRVFPVGDAMVDANIYKRIKQIWHSSKLLLAKQTVLLKRREIRQNFLPWISSE